MSRNFSSFLFIKQNLLAKLLVLIACACFVGKGWGQTFSWNGTYAGTGTNRTFTSAAVSGVTMTATIVNSENVWQESSPKWIASGSTSTLGTSCSGLPAANQGLLLSTDWSTNTTKTITTTIIFSSPVRGPVRFSLYDLNDNGFGQINERVEVSATNSSSGAVNISRTDPTCVQNGGGTVTGINSTTLILNSGNSSSCTCWGNNEVIVGTTSDCISTVTILFRSMSGANNNPAQYIVISNLTGTIQTATAPTGITGNTTICSGSSTTLTATGGSATSQWFTGSCGGTSVGTGASITVSPTTATTYFVRNFTSQCGFSSCVSTTVNVNSPPTSVSAGPNITICAGSTLNLTGAATGNTSWSWLGPNNFSSTVQSPSITSATTAASGTYFLTAQNSCGTGSGLFDNFSDNNFTSNPGWTPQPNTSSGVTPTTWSTGVSNLIGSTTNSEEVISTPSTQTFGTWKFDFTMAQINNSNAIISFVFLSNLATLNGGQGYYLSVRGNPTTTSSVIYLRRYNGTIAQFGDANNILLGSYNWNGDLNPHSLTVTRATNGVFSIYLDNVLLGTTASDLTYTTSNFAGFYCYSSSASINHAIDNIVCSSTLVDVTVNAVATPGTFQYANGSTQTICVGNTTSCANTVSPTAGSGTLGVVWYCGELLSGTPGATGTYGNWVGTIDPSINYGIPLSNNLLTAIGGVQGAGTTLTGYNPQSDFPGKTNFWIIRRAYNSNCGVCVPSCIDQSYYLNLTPVTAAPTISTPICSGATTISGTSAANASVIVTVNGVAQTPVTANGSGNWSATVSPLTASQSITATAQVSGQCVSSNSNSVTISASPTTANVSSATLSVCGTLTSGSLGGNTPTNGTGTWSIFSGGSGSFSSGNSGSSTFTANAYGTYVLRWTISNSPCGSSTADVTVTFIPPISFANTQSPTSGTICVGGTYSVYGKVFINGVTPNAGATSGLVAELGYSTTNSNPNTWTNWQAANFSSQVVNDDEYLSTLTGLAAGTYYYAFRYSYNGCPFVYGGTGGIWSSNSGVLTVNDCFGIFASAPNLTSCNTAVAAQGAYYNTTGSGSNLINSNGVNFQGYNYGSYFQNSAGLVLKGAELKTFKNNTGNVCSARMYYRVYSGAPSGAFSSINLPFYDNCSGGAFPTGGPCNTGDQKWRDISQSINLTNYTPGNYNLEVYYEITGSHLGGCGTTMVLNNSGSNYVSSFTILVPSAGNTGPYCQGNGTVTLSAVNGGTSYTWSGPNSFNNATQNPSNGSPSTSNSGTYTVTVNFGGCTQTAQTTVVVNSPTTPTFNQVQAICAGATLSALPTTSTNGITGTWAPALDNTQTTTYTFTPTAGLCATTTTMTITVNPLPSGIANSNSPFCAGQAINLTATDGFSTYAWSGPNSFSNATQNPSISNAQAVNTGTYTLTVTDGNGCQATSSTVVSLTTSPTAANNGPICVGGALSLSTNAATSYSWSGPNSFTSSVQNPTVSASATTAMAGTYTVSVIGSCAAATGVVDNFSDGNFTANPVWTVGNGNWEVPFGQLNGSSLTISGISASSNDRIYTNSNQAYGSWEYQFKLETTAYGISSAVRYFVISSTNDLTNTNGYYVYADGAGNLKLIRRTGATATDLISTTYSANTSWRLIKVTRNFSGLFTLFLDNVAVGTFTDNTYLTSSFIGIWTTGFDNGDNPLIDNVSSTPPASATTTVVVNSAPTISNKTGTICSGNTYTMVTASPDVVPVGTTYSWSFTANPSITGAANGTAQGSFAQTLTNTSSMPQTIVYSVTPTVGSCSGTPFTVTITVDAPLNGGTVSTDQTICSGGTPTTLTSVLLPSGGSGLGITGSVQIGTQYWMNSNLNVVNYNDGTPVGTNFIGTAGAYSWYSNSLPTWGQYYGGLYNWYAVNTGKLCPSGWHVPTQAEWNTLITTAGGTLVAGKKLKSCRTVTYGCPTILDPRWDADANDFGTDDFGFAALPAGRAYISSGNLIFERVRTRTRFWASTQNDVSNGDTYEFNDNSSGVNVFYNPKDEGYSVRCMGDNATTIQNSYTYQWQQDPGCTGVWSNITVNGTGLNYSPGALTQTTCFRRVTTDACGTAFSNTITITVTPGPVITAMTATICSGQAFSVTPVNGTNGTVPVGTTYTWSAPVMSGVTGGSAQAAAQTSISQTLTNTTTSNGTATYTVTATTGTCTSTFTITVTVLPPLVAGSVQGISTSGGGPGNLVIYQVYGAGGNSGATYTNDFVVLYNPTASAVNLSGWSLQYASNNSTSITLSGASAIANLSGSINSGGYFLVSLNSGGVNGGALPTVDLSNSSIPMGANNGKVFLCNSTSGVVIGSNGCSSSSNIVDFVGFGTANCSEGSSSITGLNTTNWTTRKNNGCLDNNVNSTDFLTGNITAPRNSASPTNFCTTISNTETICAGQNASNITSTPASGANGTFTYQWYSQVGDITCPTGSSTAGWTLIPSATNLTYSPGVVTSTTTYALYITATGANNCGGIWATDCRKVIVNPAPIVTDMTTTICSGTAFSGTPVDVTNGTIPSGTTYTWTVATNSNITGQSAQATAQSSISQTLTNTTTTSQTVVYTVTPTFGTCVGATFTLTVTVNPSPILSNASISACTGVPFSHTPTGSNIPTGTTYSWSAPSGSNFTGGASGSAASTVDGTLTLSSGSSTTAVYNVTPTFSGCAGNSFTVTVSLSSCAPPVPFTACNLVVYKIGDGSTVLSSNAFPVAIEEVSTSGPTIGTAIQNVSSIFLGSNLLTQSGASSSSGFMNSNNGFLAVPGLNSALGIGNVANQNTKVTHVIDGTQTTNNRFLNTASAPIPFNNNAYRSVVPTSATTFYCSGDGSGTTTGGIWYFNGVTYTQIYNTIFNIRNIEIFNGNLYFTTGSGSNRGLYQVGTGLPTTSGQSATLILSNGLTDSSPYNFSISPDDCVIYLNEDGNGGNNLITGIHKWQKINGVWTFQYKYTAFARGLVVDYKEAITKIYATTSISSGVVAAELIHITDNGSFSSPIWTLSAGANNAFAGVDFTPNSTTPITNPITTQPIASASLCNTQTQTLSVSISGSPTYQWYSNTVNSSCGATPISGAVNATYTPPATGVDGIMYYFVKISVNCSQIFLSNISAITTIINPSPTATNNGPICVGGTLTLATPTISGATYSWTGPNSFASSTQNPTVTTNATSVHAGVYSVTTTVSGCTSPAGTTNVVVNQNPSINALSPP